MIKRAHVFVDKDINNMMETYLGDMSIPFIPRLVSQHGCYYSFEFPDYNFVMSHEDACCRVAAIYAFALMSHKAESEYFIAEYNSATQKVIAVPFNKLLRNVFYARQCNGAYFKLRKESGDDNDITKC